MKRLMTTLFAVLVSAAFAGDVFYWQVAYNEWGDYGDPANWSLSADGYSNPEQRIPGAEDTLFIYNNRGGAGTWYYDYAKFDLGGARHEVSNYLAQVGYRGASVNLMNGTFVVHDPSHNQQSTCRFDVRSGATLVYDPDPNTWVMVAGNGTMDQWVVYEGGRGEMYGKLRLGGVPGRICYQVKEGGTLVFDPTGFNTSGNNYGNDGVYFENSGTFIAPHGINWNGQSTNQDGTQGSTYGGVDPMRFVQKAGTMILGGDFCKTALNVKYPGNMRFELAGGTLVVSNSVSFYTTDAAKDLNKGWDDQVFASMPDGASATVDVTADSSIDMTPFTFGAGAVLTKIGPGKLTIGANRPSTLTVYEGTLAFSGVVTDLANITFANGSTLEFAVPGNELDAIPNAANMTFPSARALWRAIRFSRPMRRRRRRLPPT